MGEPMSRNQAMDQVVWRLVDDASDMLDPAECEAVRGDLAESGGVCREGFV